MKLFLPILLLATQIQTSDLGMVNTSQVQCSLAIEVSPLTYTFVTRTISVRIRLVSSCMRLRDFVFEAFYSLKRRMNQKRHPRTIILDILGNKYTLAFSGRRHVGRRSIMRRYKYTRVTLKKTKRPNSTNVNCENFHRLMLDPRKGNVFGMRKLHKLLDADNPVICDVSRKLKSVYCELN